MTTEKEKSTPESGKKLLESTTTAKAPASDLWGEPNAGFSGCRTWRYWLSRRWGGGDALVVIGLNPSTADETEDDPTIRRCIGYGRAWGFGKLVMLNLFAYRATDPKEMKKAADPIGSFNDATLRSYARDAGMILAAWGAHGDFKGRGDIVRRMLSDRPLYCLGVTNAGQPKHPLYLRADLQPERLLSALDA